MRGTLSKRIRRRVQHDTPAASGPERHRLYKSVKKQIRRMKHAQ